MKTISMPLLDYENDIRNAKESGIQEAYSVLMHVLFHNITYPRQQFDTGSIPSTWFNYQTDRGGYVEPAYLKENWQAMIKKIQGMKNES